MNQYQKLLALGFVITQVFVSCSCRKQYADAQFSNIRNVENTFLINGFYTVSMFEYAPVTEKLTLCRKWNTNGYYTGSGAIYYPDKDVVFTPYGFKQEGPDNIGNPAYQGMLVLMADGTQKQIEFSQADGFNGSEYLYPYGQNRLLISHSIFRKAPIDPNLGYLDSVEYSYSDNINTDVAIGKKVKIAQKTPQHIFMYSSVFDMDAQRITQSLKLPLSDKAEIFDRYLYENVGSSFIKVDLTNGTRELFLKDISYPEVNQPRKLTHKPRGEEDFGMPSGYQFFVNNTYYAISESNAYNVCDKTNQIGVRPPNARLLGGWESNSIYRFDQQQDLFTKVYTFPTDDFGYMLSPNNRDIVLFDRKSGNVYSYNTQNKTAQTYHFNNQGYSVFRVTYNKDFYFVLLEQEPHSDYTYNNVAVAIVPRNMQGSTKIFKLANADVPSSAEYSVISTPYFVSNGAYKCFRSDFAPAPTGYKRKR